MPDSTLPPPPVGDDKRKKYSTEDILQRFKKYIGEQKPGLQRFYKLDDSDQLLASAATRGSTMTEKLIAIKCPDEVSAALSLLALYDVVLFIDNSISMGIEENGARVKTLINTLKAVSKVYSFSENEGLTAVRLLNTSTPYFKVTTGKINPLMKRIVFEGVTTIGTKLRDKVLLEHVKPEMKKPLLVIVLTDAEVEGENPRLLRDVIVSQAVALQKQEQDAKLKPSAPQAVAYQFAKIGNNKPGQDLVTSLRKDEILGSYIDCMGDHENKLEDLLEAGCMWKILPKLLLGAISDYWNTETAISDSALEEQDSQFDAPPAGDDELVDDGDEGEDLFAGGT